MRVVTVPVMLVALLGAACRFDPTGGTGAISDAATVDAPAIDGRAVDAQPIDAPPIDATAVDAQAACPASYNVEVLGHRFRFGQIAMQFVQAGEDCADDFPGRTHLATFEVTVFMDSIVSMVDPGNQATPFVGAKCGTNCGAKASWSWITAIPVDVGFWNDNEPDAIDSETAAMVERQNGTWKLSNTPATSTLPYICECDP